MIVPDASSIADFAPAVDDVDVGGDAPLRALLRRALRLETARWPRIAPEGTAFVVLPLEALRRMAAAPGFAGRLVTEHILAPEEARRLAELRFAKRRVEWLGGRLAAKRAILDFLGADALPSARLVIENDEHGRPVAREVHLPSPHLSITHSGDFAAALAADRPCGLDVQEICSNLAEVRDYFANAEEITLGGRDAGETAWLARIWSAKEAVKKCRYPAEATFMERITVTGREGDTLFCRLSDSGETVSARTALRGGYAVALCLAGDAPPPGILQPQQDTNNA